jgi:N-acetylmuramoyl-L-alanine amidase
VVNEAPADPDPSEPDLSAPSEYDGVRVVVIDAGHGGRDPGSIGSGGLREKTVALGVARALARRLEGRPGIEVRMIRDDDTFVPIWDRGNLATEMKGDRPGILVSIHANAFSSSARGFETYFLSEARTDHERRVAAIENAPVHVEREEGPVGDDLDFILRELRNLDHQHWSHLLAQLVQEDVDAVHPGPNRGVKQAPLAVITNALMPAVLVEVGFVSHPQEARLLASERFQEETGHAIADSVLRFFERYPPGSWSRAGQGR